MSPRARCCARACSKSGDAIAKTEDGSITGQWCPTTPQQLGMKNVWGKSQMIMCIDGDKSYSIDGLYGKGDKRVPGKKYAEWKGCRAALLYAGNPYTASRYVVSGSDENQCWAAARHFGINWTHDMWDGQYGPCWPSKKEAEKAAEILGVSTDGCRLR